MTRRSGNGGASDRSGDARRRSPLLRWALLAYPRERRERDGDVLLDCAAELVAAGASRLGEAAGLVRGGVAHRLASVRSDVLDAPWGAVGERLAVPLAGANLALWLVGASRLWGSGPLGSWWTLVLAEPCSRCSAPSPAGAVWP